MDSMTKLYLIGDSMSAGYAPVVERELSGKVITALRPVNGKDTRVVLASLDSWLGKVTSDVIHFNCGLHDIKRPYDSGQIHVPIDEYEENLTKLVGQLRQYADMLIWARSTPVVDGQLCPTKSFDRRNRDVDAYNLVADRVMTGLDVPINDLHGAIMRAGVSACLSEDGVHMTEFGYDILGKRVAEFVRTALLARHESLGQ